MHFATDVAAGALAGGLWMVIVVRTLLRQRAEDGLATWRPA
jgi:membrane-associated phospholipid phosphatase